MDGLFAGGNVNDMEAGGAKLKSRTPVGRRNGIIYELEDDAQGLDVEDDDAEPSK